MPKRSAESAIEYYLEKIRRIKEQQTPDQDELGSPTARTYNWSSSDEENSVVLEIVNPDENVDKDDVDAMENNSAPTVELPTENPTVIAEPPAAVPAVQETPELDPEILSALGEATDSLPEFGENIHPNLTKLWTPLLKKGLAKENKEKLLKEYLIPENCKLLQAPRLNPEITAAISELSRNRDKKMTSNQQQLGHGITAVSRALTTHLTSDDKLKSIKQLSDACRILCDMHYLETHYRTKLITPGLDKAFCQLIQDKERDETLFGNKLSDHIKASKVIEKQGLQIKKPINNSKPSTSQLAPKHTNVQGNWTGHPRSSNRGGRGGGRKPPTSFHQQRPAPAQSQPHHQNQHPQRQQSSIKPRAPPPQR